MNETALGPRRVPWEGPHPPEERELVEMMEAEGLRPYAWSNSPHYVYGEHDHPYHKVLYAARGSIRFVVEGQSIELRPGDRLELPPRTRHSAYVGPEGVVCLEATRDLRH